VLEKIEKQLKRVKIKHLRNEAVVKGEVLKNIKNIIIIIYNYYIHMEDGGVYDTGQQVEVNENGTWIPGLIQGVANYTVRYTATGRNITRQPNQVRLENTLDQNNTGANTNIMPGSQVEFQNNPRQRYWPPGTLVSKNYILQIDGRTITVPHTRIRRPGQEEEAPAPQPRRRNLPQPPNPERAEWRANVARWRAELARPAMFPEPRPAGVAFEVHTAFDEFKAKKWNKFMEIINRTTGTNTNFRNMRAPLQPLIDYVNANTSYTPEKKADIIEKINRIFTQIQGYSNYNENIDNITNCIQYVLMQSPDFIDAYINTFVVDCFKAYTTGDPESCVKGMYERIYLAFRDTVSTLCLDQIQGISAASLCKPDYIEIYDCFYETIPQSLLNDFSKEWYEERGGEELAKLSPEARIEDFVGFVKGRMNDEARFSKAEASIRRYANKEINILFGGKRLSGLQKRSNTRKRQSKRVRKIVKRRKTVKKRSGGKKQSGGKKRSIKKL
jgi:hypothetical protein